MNEQIEITPYWKPEPQPRDGAYWSLLIPAIVYVTGVCIYSVEAMKAGTLIFPESIQTAGSALMVVGGETGTIATAMEVFRKYKIQETNWLDWTGLFVSLAATLGNLFVIFTRQTAISAGWVTWALVFGPLALLLCSGLDFYANVMELGFFRASFGERWRKWNDDKHVYEQGQRTRKRQETQTDSKPDTQEIEIVPSLTPEERQVALLALWAEHPRTTQAQAAVRFGVRRQTISNDFTTLAKAGKVSKRNGSGYEVQE